MIAAARKGAGEGAPPPPYSPGDRVRMGRRRGTVRRVEGERIGVVWAWNGERVDVAVPASRVRRDDGGPRHGR